MRHRFLLLAFLASASVCPAKNEFTLNFNNVDIKSFIKFVGEFTRENYVLDPNVRGNVTVYSQKPVPAEQVDAIFSAILNLHGYSVVRRDQVSLIVPLPDAKTSSRDVNVGPVPAGKVDAFLTQIVPLKHYPANVISQILTPYLSKGAQITVEERTNALLISDVGRNVVRLMEIVEKIDTPAPAGKEDFKLYRLQNAVAEDVAKVLNDILSKKRTTRVATRLQPAATAVQASVVAVKATNSLIVYADPDDFETIEGIVKEIDIMTGQVLIEALIAEVTYEKESDIGVEWSAADTFRGDKYTWSAETDLGVEGTIAGGLRLGVLKGTTDLGAILKLYTKDSRFNILSTPQIMTADNQEASINVSENRPFLKETRFVSGTDTDDTIKSYDYKDVGIVLKITPQISADKYVRLKLHQEVTKVLETGADGTLTTAKREADTTLIVPNNKTVVLGGLIRNETERSVSKVPFFGDVPLLKHLFRRKSDGSVKTNLLIFITPHIVTNFEEAEKIRKEKAAIVPEANQ